MKLDQPFCIGPIQQRNFFMKRKSQFNSHIEEHIIFLSKTTKRDNSYLAGLSKNTPSHRDRLFPIIP